MKNPDSIDKGALSRLIARREDAHQRLMAAIDAEREVTQRVQRLQARAAEIAHVHYDDVIERDSSGRPIVIAGRSGATREMVDELQEALAEQAALRQRRAEAEVAHAPIAKLVAACREYAAEHGVRERDIPAWAPAPPATGPAPSSEAIEQIRGEIAGVQRQIRALARADRPTREEAYARIDQAIRVSAERATLYADGGRGLQFASSTLGPADQAVNLLALVAPDQLRTMLHRQADDDADRRGGYGDAPEAERLAHREALQAELLELERKEERMLRDAEAAGATVDRRPDMSPAACLAVFHRSPATGRVPGTPPPEPTAPPRRRRRAERSGYLKRGTMRTEAEAHV